MTRLAATNFQGQRALKSLAEAPRMLHYCYAEPGFNKHQFETRSDMERRVWNVAPGDVSICGMIRRQLIEARGFYGIK